MKSTEIDAVVEYVAEVARLAKTGKATEHSFRGALASLIDALAPGLKAVNEPKRTDCGAPDYIVQDRTGLAVFYVEAKDIGDGDLGGKKRTGHKEQFDRYKAALDTIIFTDYLDFRLYRHGQPVCAVMIADWDGECKVSGKPVAYADLAALVADAAAGEPQKIDGAKRLAELMAGKARMLQSAALAYLRRVEGTAHSASAPYHAPLFDMMLDFRKMLMPEVGAEEFSDIFAQTLTYGMFAARLNDPTPEDFSRYEAMALIPKTNPFLKRLFGFIASDLESELTWIVDDLADLFRAADVDKIMRQYAEGAGRPPYRCNDGRAVAQRPPDRDPMLHFYEDFLAAYDGDLRKKRGVWYTPIQVVRFIVAAADWALRTRFGLPDGLADSSKTEIEVEETAFHGKKLAQKVKKTVHRVQLLDPATGTGTFIAEALRQVHAKFAGNEGMWPGYVENDLLPRLNGFELLMASYTMAHIKLDMALRECANVEMVPISNCHSRFRIFLTDSLSDWHKELPGGLFAAALGAEQEGADEVKRDIPVMVVVGNPPYSGESQNKGEWIMRLMEDYKVEPGGKERLKERNPKWLNDDYVKFIRLAEHYVEKNGEGIVAYITPHGFLDNPTFRGMRWHLMQTFDEIWTLNLHGNSKKKEVAPDGGKDECVFDIMQGVAITLFVKCCQCGNVANANSQCQSKRPKELKTGNIGTGNNSTLATIPRPCRIYYADLWGKKAAKLAALDSATMDTIDWQEINPTEPMLFFTPKDTAGEAEWNAAFGIAELMKVNSVSVVTANDKVLVGSDEQELREKICATFGEKPDREKIKRYAYRPFDERCIYYDLDKVERPREKVMLHLLYGECFNAEAQRRREGGMLLSLRGDMESRSLGEKSPSLQNSQAPSSESKMNIALLTCRQLAGNDWSHVFVAEHMIDDNCVSNKSKERGYVFPLYLYEENMGKVEKRVNLDKDIVAKIAAVLKRDEVLAYYHGFELGRTWYDVASCDDISSLPTIAVTPDPAVDRAKAKAIFRAMKPVRNLHDGKVVAFPVRAARKMFATSEFDVFAIAGSLGMLFENSRRAWSENAVGIPNHKMHPEIDAYHQYVAAMRTGGERYFIRFTVRENRNGGARNELHGTTVSRIFIYKAMGVEPTLRTHTHGEDSAPIDGARITYPFPAVKGENEGVAPFIDYKIALFFAAGQSCGVASPLSAEDVFDYIYGVLHSPAYRAKFKEFLKSDFPRIPYPKDGAEFARYRDAGRELRIAHLMLDPPPTLSELTARFPVPGSNVVENVASVKVLPMPNSNSQLETGNNGNIGNTSICRVYINPTQYFDNVPIAAWEQAIGGYHPAEKWLKDRKGRALTQDDLRHYQRIILALAKTCEIMKALH